jgi:hypothetical protein
MAIASVNDMIAAQSAGRRRLTQFNKISGGAAYAAGRSYEMFSLNGYPVATTFPGTAKACVNCSDALGDGTNKFGIPHGGNVSAYIKHLVKIGALSTAATGVPATLKLVDLVSYWPGINMNDAAVQTLSGTPDLTRWPNGDGLQLSLAARSTTGSTAHNLEVSYTNQAGTSGRALAATVACTVSAIVPHIVHSGTAANNYGPGLPLGGGDTGVQNVANVDLSAASGSASTAVLLLWREIQDISISITNGKVDVDCVNQFMSMPRIPDDACLGFILQAGAAVAANTNFLGDITTLWG